MTWLQAVSRACQLWQKTKHRWYVRGYQKPDGKWAYGCYAVPEPTIAMPRRTEAGHHRPDRLCNHPRQDT